MGLTFTRSPGETICIGDDIEVTVVRGITGRLVIDVTAPVHIPVHRKEVLEKIRAERAAGVDDGKA